VGARPFPLDLDEAEVMFGFEVKEADTGERLAVVELGSGLRAVKVRSDDGRVEYAVCDAAMTQLYRSAKTLDELRARFRAK
jgi:hypothetical protein